MENNITDAEIISVTNNDDLINRLNTATDIKEPTKSEVSKSWSFSLDEETKVKEQETPIPETTPSEPQIKTSDFATEPAPKVTPVTPSATTPSTEPKLSKDFKLASARITVSALDMTQRMIFTPLINRKYHKKFTDQEIKDLDEKNIIDEEKSNLKPEDLPLRNKFDRLMKKRDKKIKDIPFEDIESQDLEKMFYQYMDATNKNLPPEIMLVIGIGNVLGKRAIDLFTE